MNARQHAAEGLSASDLVTALHTGTVVRTGSFELAMTPQRALPLFTAPGETLWVPAWEPTVLSGDGMETGTVFVTSHHGRTTYWLVMDYDTRAHRALYVRVTPEHDAGTVEVSIVPYGEEGSTVTVTYRLTALTAAGNETLQESFSESNYAEMMQHWKALIEEHRERIDAHLGTG